MHRSTLTAILLSAILLCAKDGTATDVDAHAIVEICLLPHQTGICDVIFTGTVADGTVVSNDDDYRTMFPRYTAIPFSQINYIGSNYWPTTRALSAPRPRPMLRAGSCSRPPRR